MIETLARLSFHLELQEGFWFALVVAADSDVRDHVRNEVGEHVLHTDPEGLAPELVRWEPGPLHWVEVRDLEAAAVLLLGLNERREALRRQFRRGLILSGPPALKSLLRNLAPDLFSVRACILEPSLAGARPIDTAAAPSQAVRPDVSRLNARRALTTARQLAGRRETQARRAHLAALQRACEALLAQGWVTEVAPVADELRSHAYALASEHLEDVWLRDMVCVAEEATAAVRRAQGDLDGAIAALRSAMWIRGLLLKRAGEQRALREVELARVYGRLGQLHLLRDEPKRAEELLDKALRLREPHTADPFVASELGVTHSLLGDVHLRLDDPTRAAESYARALGLRQELAELHPSPYFKRHLSVAWGRLGTLAERTGDLPSARRHREQALALAKEVARSDTANVTWQMDLSVAWSRLGDAARAEGDVDEARRAFRKALAIRERLVAEDPENVAWERLLAIVLARLSELGEGEGTPG